MEANHDAAPASPEPTRGKSRADHHVTGCEAPGGQASVVHCDSRAQNAPTSTCARSHVRVHKDTEVVQQEGSVTGGPTVRGPRLVAHRATTIPAVAETNYTQVQKEPACNCKGYPHR